MNIVMIIRLISLFGLILTLTTMDLKAQSSFESLREKLDQVKIMDGPYLEGSLQDKKFVNSHVQKSWREIAVNIDIFTAKQQQKIIAAAMDNLDDPTYLEFCITFLGLLKKQQIDIISGKYLIMPNETKQGFLAVNYKDQNLSSVLSEVRDLFVHEPSYLQFIDNILSGNANNDFMKFMEGTGLKARLPVNNLNVISEQVIIDQQLQISNKLNSKPSDANLLDHKHANFLSWFIWVSILLAVLAIMVWQKVRKPKPKC